jgi:uncharacterized radical SAM protein YgiQ
MLDRDMFLPTTPQEIRARGWDGIDVLIVSGDAYVDHPAFGVAALGRVLESEGFRVAVLPQPRFDSSVDFASFPAPRLFVGIAPGTVDSMLNNYTATKKPRSDDMYSEGGRGGKRPDYAAIVYARLAREAFPEVPIIAGGVEVSLRRLAHYDYWQNRVRPSILMDIAADFVAFGMGERTVVSLATTFAREVSESGGAMLLGTPAWERASEQIRSMRGIAYVTTKDVARTLENRLTIPSFDEVKGDKRKFARATLLVEQEASPLNGKKVLQYHGGRAVVCNEMPLPLSTAEFDAIYKLPFTKHPHPRYREKIPAEEMIRFSCNAVRGCYGGCSFCAITLHQGRIVQSRSLASVLNEISGMATLPGFTGHVSDVGGPSANMYATRCKSDFIQSKCRKLSCLFPKPCPHLVSDHGPQIELLKRCRALPGVKSIRIASGIRYDLAFADSKNGEHYLRDVVKHHVGGQLKVAPEHLDPAVLDLMRKPGRELFERFLDLFYGASASCGKEQYVVPYFISGFPGCTHDQMRVVQQFLQKRQWNLQQVQSFIPTPMTMATAMYYAGMDPVSRQEIFVAKAFEDKKIQQAILQPKRHAPRHSSRPMRRR